MSKKLTLSESFDIMNMIADKLSIAIDIDKANYHFDDINAWIEETARELFVAITDICGITEVVE